MDSGYDYEDKYLLKYGALEQDFEELQADAEEVTSLLKQAKEKKHRLQAEIKLLRKRAMELRELRDGARSCEAPYLARETATADYPQCFYGSFEGSTRKMLAGREFYPQAFRQPSHSQLPHTQPFNSKAMKPLSKATAPPINGVVFRNPNVVGVLKKSSSKPAAASNGIVAAKKAGKRKISWQDDYSVQA